jgi:hypothetical protein
MGNNIQAISTEELKEPPKAEVVARLRASKLLFTCEYRQRGKEAGRRWAEQDASYKQLERLKQSYYGDAHHQPDFDCWTVAMIACGGDDDQARDFWEGFCPEWRDLFVDDDFAFGFVDGATDVLDEVEPLI